MINVVILLLAHWCGDFFCQSRDVAERKSTNMWKLLAHLSHVGAWLFSAGVLVTYNIYGSTAWQTMGITPLLVFVGINVVLHGIIDVTIWRGYKMVRQVKSNPDFPYWRDALFYDFIGLDQMLHMMALAFSIRFLIGG